MMWDASCRSPLACAALALLLAACGGGGGGGGAPDLSTAPGISLTPTSLSFAAVHNGALPPTQNVSISITRPFVFLGLAVPAANPPTWLDLSQGRLTTTTWTAAISSTFLAPGTYTTTISIGIADGNQNVLAYRNVQVSYTVQPRVGLGANPNGLTFSQVQGTSAPTAQTLSISDLENATYAWNASVNYQSGSGWLTINGGSSTAGATLPTSLSIGVVPQVALGTLSATIHVTGNNNTLDIPVSYTLSEPQVTPSAPTLTFNALRLGQAPATQKVTLTTQLSLPVGYTTSVTYGAGASGWLTLPASGSAPENVTFGVNSTTLAPGSYTGNVVINTATQAIPVAVTYIVSEPTLTRSPSTLTFNAPSGGSVPASQDVTLSTQQSVSLDWTASISYGAGATGWLSLTPSSGTAPGTATVNVNTTALAPANYTATVSFTTVTQTVSIGVTYVVAASTLTLGPSSASFTIDATSQAAALTQPIAVGSTGIALSWTATSSQPWISVPPSGSSGSSIDLNLVPAELNKLDAGTSSATITFSYTPPGQAATTASLPVSLNLKLPKVNYVSPYVQLPGTSTEVILRGSGFSNTTGLDVMFGPNAVATHTVVSDTEIRVTHPPLAAGSYPVTFQNQLGLSRTRARLLIAASQTFIAAAVPTSLSRDRSIYDAERVAVYTNNNFAVPNAPPGVPRIERNRLVNGVWVTDSLLLNEFLRDIAMTPDGTELLALTDTSFYHVNLSTFAISGQVVHNGAFAGHVGMGNDGNALVFSGAPFLYNVLTRAVTQIGNVALGSLLVATASALDGSRVIVGMQSPDNLYYYEASTAQVTLAFPNLIINRMTIDRTGTTSIVDGVVYNRQFLPQGGMPLKLGHSVVSPDGTRGHAVIPGEIPAVLRSYDLTSPDGQGGFTEIGTGIPLAADPGERLVLGITPDGSTVFVSGEKKFVVQPLP